MLTGMLPRLLRDKVESKEASVTMPREQQEEGNGNSTEMGSSSSQVNITMESDRAEEEQLSLTMKKEFDQVEEKNILESKEDSVTGLREKQKTRVGGGTELVYCEVEEIAPMVSVKMEYMEEEEWENEVECKEAFVTVPVEVRAGGRIEVETVSTIGEILSIEKEDDQNSPVVEREYDDDICSLLESSGYSRENEPFPALRFREPSSSNSESGESREQGNLCGLEDTVEMVSGSSVDCKPLSNFFLNTTKEGRLHEVDQKKSQERMLLDLGSSDEEVSMVKASYVSRIESDNEQKKQHESELEIKRLEAIIEGLSSAKGLLEVEAHVNKKKSSELKEQIIQIRSLLEPMQVKVLKQTKLLETKSEKLQEMEQLVKAFRDKPQTKDCCDTGKGCKGVNEIRLRNKELEATLVQKRSELKIKSSEMERSTGELKKNSILIQELEKDLVLTQVIKHKDMMQHNRVVLVKDILLNYMSKEQGKRENQLTHSQEECMVKIKECEELQIELNLELKTTDRLKAAMIDADIRLALEMVKRNDLERKVEGMQKLVEDLKIKINNKDVDLNHQIDLLVKITKENLVKDGKNKEYCKANHSLLQEVKLKTREVEELKSNKLNSENKCRLCQKVNIASSEVEVKLVEKSVEKQAVQEKLEEREAEFSHILMQKSKSLKRQSENIFDENSKIPRMSGDHNKGGHSLETVSSLPVPFLAFPCLSLPSSQTSLPSRVSSTVEYDCSPPNTPYSLSSPDPTSSQHQSLLQTSPTTQTTASQPRVQQSFLRVRDITTMLDEGLQASLAEKEELARIRLKREVAEHVKIYLQPYMHQSKEPLDLNIWKISSNEDFVEICRSQSLLCREEILEGWRKAFSPREDLKITEGNIARIQEKIHFFFTVRKVIQVITYRLHFFQNQPDNLST